MELNSEDARVANAVAVQAESIAQAIDVIADRIQRGGRLIYLVPARPVGWAFSTRAIVDPSRA